jgi:hypothetical protein
MTDSDLNQGSRMNHLSEQGAARRDAILHDLIGTMQIIHRRRRIRRRAVLTGLPLLLVGLAIAWIRLAPATVGRSTSSPSIAQTDRTAPADTPEPARTANVLAIMEFVQTDPEIVARMSVPPGSAAEILSDQQLVASLAAMDRPAGLIRNAGRAWLTRSVVDSPDAPTTSPDHGSS